MERYLEARRQATVNSRSSDQDGSDMLYLRAFGGCQLDRDGLRLDDLSAQRKALGFLAVLACAGVCGVSRDAAAVLLWPESDQERARASLKQLVHSLRTRLGLADVVLGGNDLRLNPEHLTSDVAEFADALRRTDRVGAARLYAGPFLDGFHLRGSVDFEQWVTSQRATFGEQFARVVRQLAEQAERDGDHASAVSWWRRLVDDDRFSARATRGLMRALDATGERAAALRHAELHQRIVREELGIDPDASVAMLADELRRAPAAKVGPVTGRVTSASPEIGAMLSERAVDEERSPILVVLPFVNTSGAVEDEHFSDGLTDELIGTIGKLRGIAVIGRTSAFAFKGKHADVATIAGQLHATAILEGSVRRHGTGFKIGVQLVRAPDGVVLWSEIYEREARDLFAVQTEIARSVSRALRVQLGANSVVSARSHTTDEIAHDLYLRGQLFLNRVSATDLRQAIACFERAVQRDPGYARAHAGLADAHLLLAIMGHSPAPPEIARVHAAVARALALDGALAEAHTSLACVLFAFDWNWEAAEREFERAIELSPGYGLAHHRYGLFLMYQTRFDEAQQVFEGARASDPLAASVNMNLGRLHLNAGRPAVAIPLLLTAIELSPQLALAHEQLGYAHLRLGAIAEALAAFRRVAELSGRRGTTRLAYALGVTGDRSTARKLMREVADDPAASAEAFGLALACTGLGDRDGAFGWLDRAHDERDAFLHTIKAMPAFEPLHADHRWESLLGRIGLAAAVPTQT